MRHTSRTSPQLPPVGRGRVRAGLWWTSALVSVAPSFAVLAVLSLATLSSATASELSNGATITASDPLGLQNTTPEGTNLTLTINPATQAITLGTFGDPTKAAIALPAANTPGETLVITILDGNTVTMAGEFSRNDATDTISIFSATNLVFRDDIDAGPGATIHMGNANSNPSRIVAFDSGDAAVRNIDIAINAIDAGDNITLDLRNTAGAAKYTFQKAIGGTSADTEIDRILIQDGVSATFNGAIRAGNIEVRTTETLNINNTVSGPINLMADGTVNVAANIALNAGLTTDENNQGTLNFANAVNDITLIGNDVGSSTNALKGLSLGAEITGEARLAGKVYAETITINGRGKTTFAQSVTGSTITLAEGGNAEFGGDVTGNVDYAAGGTITVLDNHKIIGSVTTAGTDSGTLNFGPVTTNTELVSGNVGSAQNRLDTINTTVNTGAVANFGGEVHSSLLTLAGDGTLALSRDFSGNVRLLNDGTLRFDADTMLSGAITTALNGQGTLVLGTASTADRTVAGDTIGTAAAALKRLSVGADATRTATLADEVHAQTITITGAGKTVFNGDVVSTTTTLEDGGEAQFDGDLTGQLHFTNGGAATIAAGHKLTGTVTTAIAGQGELTIGNATSNSTIINGQVGAADAALAALTVGADANFTATVGNAVYANTLTIGGDGNTVFSGNVKTTDIDISGAGDVTFNGAVLAQDITVNDDGSTTLSNTSEARDITINGNGDTTISGTLQARDLRINGDGALTLSQTSELRNLTLDGDGALSVNDTLTANSITTTGTGAAQFDDDVTVQEDIDIAGNGTFRGTTQANDVTIDGIASFTGPLTANDISAGDQATFQSTVTANDITVEGNQATFGGAVDAQSITTRGIASFASTVTAPEITVEGATASFADTVRSETVTTTGDATFSAGLTATDVSIGGIGTFAGPVTADTVTTTSDAIFRQNINNTNTVIDVGGNGTFQSAINVNSVTVDGNANFVSSVATVDDVTVNGAGTSQFGGAVSARNINLAGDGTAQFARNITGNLRFSGNNTAILAAGQEIEGDVSTTTTGWGHLQLDGSTTITGNVGEVGGKRLGALTLNSGSGNFLGNIAADVVTFAAGTRFETEGPMAIDGEFNNSSSMNLKGTLTLGNGNVELAGAAGASLKLEPVVSYNNKVVIDASRSLSTNVSNPIRLISDPTYVDGTLVLVDTNNGVGTAVDPGKFIINDNLLTTYRISTNGQRDVVITAQDRSREIVAKEIGTVPSAISALKGAVVASFNDEDVNNAFEAVLNSGGAPLKTAAEQSQPHTATELGVAAQANLRGMTSTVSARLASIRSGSDPRGLWPTRGVAAGDGAKTQGVWMRPYTSMGTQERVGLYPGYEMKSHGITLGADTEPNAATRLGVAIGLSKTKVNSNDLGSSQGEISSQQYTVYGTYEPGAFYVEGQITYGRSRINTSRRITFAGLNRLAVGKHDASQLAVSLDAGLPMRRGMIVITPEAGVFYSSNNPNSYRETGAGLLNLQVTPPRTQILEGRLGLTAAFDRRVPGGLYRPEVRANVMYDVLGETPITTARYQGSSPFVVDNAAETKNFSYSLGLGYSFLTSDGAWEIKGDYDVLMRKGYTAHSGQINARYNF